MRIDCTNELWFGTDLEAEATVETLSLAGLCRYAVLVVDTECRCWLASGSSLSTSLQRVSVKVDGSLQQDTLSAPTGLNYIVSGCIDSLGAIHFLEWDSTTEASTLHKFNTNVDTGTVVESLVVEDNCLALFGSADGYLYYVQNVAGSRNVLRTQNSAITAVYSATAVYLAGIGFASRDCDPAGFKLTSYGPTGADLG